MGNEIYYYVCYGLLRNAWQKPGKQILNTPSKRVARKYFNYMHDLLSRSGIKFTSSDCRIILDNNSEIEFITRKETASNSTIHIA